MSITFLLKIVLFFVFAGLLPGLLPAFYLTRGRENLCVIDRLVIAAVMAPFVLVLVSFLEEAAGVPQNRTVLVFNVAAVAALSLAGLRLGGLWPRRGDFFPRVRYAGIAAYGLFAVLLAVCLLPTIGHYTPFLHDPVSHTQWLKILNTTGHVTADQWYPQGLEYFLNYGATFLGVSYAKTVLVFTNYFVALFPISMFYLGLLLVPERRRAMIFGMLALLAAAASPVPRNLFLMFGKNSMIFAFALAPLLLYLAMDVRSRIDYFLTVLLLFAVVVVHYPTGMFLFLIFFGVNLAKVWRLSGKRLLIDGRSLSGFITAVIASAALGAVLFVRVAPLYAAQPPGDDRSVSGVLGAIGIHGLAGFLRLDFPEYGMMIFTRPAMAVFLVSVAALAAAGMFRRCRDESWRFSLLVLASYAGLFLLGVILLIPTQRQTGVFYYFELRFFLVFALLVTVTWFAYFLISRVTERLAERRGFYALVLAALALLFVFNGFRDYKKYKEKQEGLRTTTAADLEAFSFIDSIEDERRILIQLGDGGGVIMGADSGVWIPSFTGKQVEVDFMDYTNPKSYEIYRHYLELAKNGDSLDAIGRLYCDYSIGYVFFGTQKVYSWNMEKETLDKSRYFEQIFDNGAQVYRISPQNCPDEGPAQAPS